MMGKSMKKHRSAHRAGKSCKKGGMCGRKHAGGKTRRHAKKGGSAMMKGLEGLVKTALVPFGLFAAQKHVQRRRK